MNFLAIILITISITISNGLSVDRNNNNMKKNRNVSEKRVEILDPRYIAEWETDFDTNTIEFNVIVQTIGFVGFGLSVSGTMNGADIVIAGVFSNSTTYFGDYHGVGNVPPVLDEKQNWDFIEGSEINGTTSLRFKRLFETCDLDGDVSITAGTIKIIWAIGETDIIGAHLPTNRGALAVNMLDPPLPPFDVSKYEREDVILNYTLLPDETVYWCTIHKRVVTNGSSQIVAFKPILDSPASLKHTHHFNMYVCKGDNLEETLGPYVDKGQDCHGGYTPRVHCQSNLYAWSFGGRILVFPDDIGFPWGFEETEYFLFEAHFDNPGRDEGDSFHTGVEIYHTKELREHEAGMLSIGHTTSPSLMIPPATNEWTLVGHCSSDCTSNALEGTEINIFNANLHAHKSGRKIKLRHFRAGQELPWLAKDYTYDFDFQENRPLRENVRLAPGDHLSIECTYDSNWRSPPGSVIGGLATSDEMCMVFLFYYPKSKLEACFSGYPTDKLLQSFGIEEYKLEYPDPDPIIIKPEEWANMTYTSILNNNISWSDDKKIELGQEMRYGEHSEYCHTLEASKFILDGVPIFGQRNLPIVSYPEFEKEYEEELPECRNVNETSTSSVTSSTEFNNSNKLVMNVMQLNCLWILIVLLKVM